MTMVTKWLRAGTDEQRISRFAILFGVALMTGPLLGLAIQTWQGLPSLPPGFEHLPAYNPAVVSAQYPIANVVITGALGAVLLVIAIGIARRQSWARPALIRFSALAGILWVILGLLWVVSALPQPSWNLKVMGIGALIMTPIGAVFLWRVINRLRVGIGA